MKMQKKRNINGLSVVILIVLIAYTLIFVTLLAWGLLTSLKTSIEFDENKLLWPKLGVQWKNYATVFEKFVVSVDREVGDGFQKFNIGMVDQLFNTFVYAFGGAFFATIIPCITAYATAKFDKLPSKVIYTIVIITMALPIIGSYPSEIYLARKLGIYDEIWGIILMKGNFLGMYYLVFYAVFKTLNKGYYEAAYLDGASEFRIMISIAIPLVKTTFSTVMLIKFIEFWNDYQTPLLYAPSHPTLAYGIWYLSNTTQVKGMSGVPLRITASMILLLPVLIIFILLRKKLMGNITVGGIKG